MSGSFDLDDYLEVDLATSIEKRYLYRGTFSVTYTILSWLTTSLQYEYRQEDYKYSEGVVGLQEDYIDNRITLSFVAVYSSQPVSF